MKWTYDVLVLIIELILFKSYLSAKGIIPESLKSIGQFSMPKLTKRAICIVRTDGQTIIIEKKPPFFYLFKNYEIIITCIQGHIFESESFP